MQYIRGVKTIVITRDGEVDFNIKLELDINVTTDGLQVGGMKIAPAREEDKPNDDFLWAIPDFTQEKIKFGEEVKEPKE